MTFRVALVGAGPAGYYAAEHLLNATGPIVSVDMFDRLPTPWGLVRAGVAPDHPKIKSVSAQFAEIAAHPRYRFFGNVELGRDVSREDLLGRYDAVLYAVGARSERRLGIPGEALPGSLAASDFVGWYNGHPDHAALAPNLSGNRAIVIGNGNVALDVARMLLLPRAELLQTDIADHALAALAASQIQDVTILGRRGPAEAAFTTPELREFGEIKDLDFEIDDPSLLRLALPDDVADSKRIHRNLAALEKYHAAPQRGGRKLAFRFLRSPVEIRGANRVEALVMGVNRLEIQDGRFQAIDTGLREVLPADLIVRAVGYKGVAMPEVPFDERSGTIPNDGGVVIGGRREYVAGWIKRGPTGVIGTNRGDAVETATHLLADLAASTPAAATSAEILNWLQLRCAGLVDHAGWIKIDHDETSNGRLSNRPRVKLVSVDDLLSAARKPAAVN